MALCGCLTTRYCVYQGGALIVTPPVNESVPVEIGALQILVAIAFWLGWLQQPRWSAWLGLFLLVSVLYFTRTMGFAVPAWHAPARQAAWN